MKVSTINKVYIFFTISCLFVSGSCKKNAVDNETVSTTNYSLATQEFIQIVMNINESSIHQKGLCNPYTVTSLPAGRTDSLSGDTTHDAQGNFTNSNYPILWIKYSNYQGPDGKIRKGTIKAAFLQQYNIVGSSVTVTLSNYSVNGVSYDGVIILTRNVNNAFVYSIVNGICVSENKTIKYNCNYIITLFAHGTSGSFGDDNVQVLGNANGINREGKRFDVSITNSIIKRADCAWIAQGTANLTPEGLHVRAIDFGSNLCDDVATFVVDGQTFTVLMSK